MATHRHTTESVGGGGQKSPSRSEILFVRFRYMYNMYNRDQLFKSVQKSEHFDIFWDALTSILQYLSKAGFCKKLITLVHMTP